MNEQDTLKAGQTEIWSGSKAAPGIMSDGSPIPSMADAKRVTANLDLIFQPKGTEFGPGLPLSPQPGQGVRAMDFPVAVNTVLTPRAYETSPKLLRALANVEIIRLCIETRKDQVESLQWSIKPRDKKLEGKATDAKVEVVRKFWDRPDGYTPFASWLRASLEDLFVGDWAAWEMRRTVGGKLIGLDVIPGDTIHPMVDATGRRPRGPTDIAYQQVIKGRPWINLTNSDLLYAPRNMRPGHNYGFSPVEQIIVTINTYMRRQAAQLAYFSEGNTPAGFITGPDGWSMDQTQDFQKWLDARISGNASLQAKLLVMPSGANYSNFKDAPLKDDFDEWLARVVTYAFSLEPTPFIKSMNKATAETDKERAKAEGLAPIKLWWKRVADQVIQIDLGEPDLEWSWDDATDIDPASQSAMDDRDLKNGSRTLDEVRERRGDAAYPGGEGSKPILYTSSGGVLVEEAIKPPEPPPAPIVQAPNDPANPTPPVSPKPKPAGGAKPSVDPPAPDKAKPVEKAEKSTLRKLEPVTVDRARPRRAIKSLTKTAEEVLQAVGDQVAADVAKELRSVSKADDGDENTPAARAAAIAKRIQLGGLSDIEDAAFHDLYDVVEDSAKEALARIGVKVPSEMFDRVDQTSADWASARAADMVAVDGDMNIVNSTREAIRTTIGKGLGDGLSIPQIADEIQASQAFSADRAALIANTEVRRANSQGVLIGFKAAQDLGINIQKVWETAGDDLVDEEDCQGNEDQGPIDLDEDFQSGDSAPPAHPNCRCNVNSYTDNSADNTATADDPAEEE